MFVDHHAQDRADQRSEDVHEAERIDTESDGRIRHAVWAERRGNVDAEKKRAANYHARNILWGFPVNNRGNTEGKEEHAKRFCNTNLHTRPDYKSGNRWQSRFDN